MLSKSALFTEYNHQKAAERKAGLNTRRIDRALGLAETGRERPYVTTLTSCTCPDFKYRRVECKHIKSLKLQQAAKREESKKREAEILRELGF